MNITLEKYKEVIEDVHLWLKTAGKPIFYGDNHTKFEDIEEFRVKVKATLELIFKEYVKKDQKGLLQEELQEYVDAKDDLEEKKDAIVDLVWVLHNASYALGLSSDALIYIYEDIMYLTDEESLEDFKHIVEITENQLDNLFKKDTKPFLFNNIYDMNSILFLILQRSNLEGLDKKLDQIKLSNFSKYTKDEKVAKDTVQSYSSGTHFTKKGEKIDTYYKQVGDFYVIFRNDGKILKSLEYKEPNEF